MDDFILRYLAQILRDIKRVQKKGRYKFIMIKMVAIVI